MLEICMLASGSSGNAVYVATENTRLLIDAGLSGRRIATALEECNIEAASLDALLISHDHNDHVSGAGVVARRYRLPVYATFLTWQAAAGRIGKIDERQRCELPERGSLIFKDLLVETFPVPHDAAAPVGFLFRNGKNTAGLVTDLGHVTSFIVDRLKNVNCLVLEANHDEKMLIEGTYPWPLKKRILSEKGHLSNHAAAKNLALIRSSATTHVVLAHLSEQNNLPHLALNTACEYLEQSGARPGRDVIVHVAERHKPSCHIRLA